MEPNLSQIINMLGKEKNIPKETIVEAIQAAILTAAKKKYGTEENIEVEVNEQKGEIEAYLYREVVDEVIDPETQIGLAEARGFDEEIEIGDEFAIRLDVEELGRIAAQTAKQVIVQRVREAEREVILAEYGGRVGETLNGIVMRMERGALVIDLGKAEGVLPHREKIPGERFERGDRVRALIQGVQDTAKAPQVMLSRNDTRFLGKLFEMEVPEIYDGVVKILKVVREPGQRAKIAVTSNDSNVDPVGACVGMKGSRVQAVVQELRGEKIDIISYTDVIRDFIEKALSPAVISRIAVNEEDHSALVVCDESQLALGIGKKGQNVRLASELTGYQINIMGEEEYQRAVKEQQEEADLEREAERNAAEQMSRLPGVGEKTAAAILAAGFRSVVHVASSSVDEVAAVPGIGPKTAEKIITSAQELAEVLKQEAAEKEKAEAEVAEAAAAEAEAAEAEAAEAAAAEADAAGADAAEADAAGADAAGADAAGADAEADSKPEKTEAGANEESSTADEDAAAKREESVS